ncbi:GL18273 [Drosophila persimilis]|uniref:GL18273 n=1 Tax=Drosophila persimilis TaxID=7234 RepID=B4H4P4_DROPE|nr:uncharacterized protein LOC6600752 [Drosophila persimilis]XP_026848660.1 uncharacterized protein LOC6600752 [Drosophila persimilis]EDW32656.1 GL18273 [Drosophila persimilis]
MCCISTHKLKLLVVCLTLLVQIDGELKAANNATLLLYYSRTKFLGYLITRIILGIFLAIWAFTGFLSLFYDSVWGVATYSSGICFLTVLDLFTLYYRYVLRNQVYTDENERMKLERRYKWQGGQHNHETLDEGIGDAMLLVINIVQVAIQVSVNIAGWWLAVRLRRHHQNEEKYEADKVYLEYLLKTHPHTTQPSNAQSQHPQQQHQNSKRPSVMK